MLFRKLLRTAWNYKAQFISMAITLCLGIGVFLGFNMEWHSLETDTASFLSETRYADCRIYSDSGFSKEDAERIATIDGVEAATRYLSAGVSVSGTKKTLTLNVSEDYTVSTMLITKGAEYDEDGDGLWLSDRFAEENGFSVGDDLTLEYKGITETCRVVGLCKSGENMICVADQNQLMPDFTTHGFAYISPKKLENFLGTSFYPQINVITDTPKEALENEVKNALGKTFQITDKELHTSYAGAKSEMEEGKTMGAILPVLFLAIAILTMVTTMHRIATNEKVQIGTLKALGFKSGRILRHYSTYGLFIGTVGAVFGVGLGYLIALLIMSPNGMMGTYLDLPEWRITMPAFCIPITVLTVLLLTAISCLSTKRMLKGTAADALRPFVPKAPKRSFRESGAVWERLPFSAKWNIRDIMRHKARSAMTLLGVFGCLLLIVGGLGMKDSMNGFLKMLNDDICNYSTKLTVSEKATEKETEALCEEVGGDRQSTLGISYNGKTVSLDVYGAKNGNIRFLTEDGELFELSDKGVYLCLRLKDTAKIGDTVEFSPYGSESTYKAKVAGYFRSLFNESIAMTESLADELELEYRVGTVYTDVPSDEIGSSSAISAKQEKDAVMSSYGTFMKLLDLMVMILIVAAIVLGTVVLYDLGIMSYVERKRELATLKVLGFKNKAISRILITQNLWLTAAGVILGIPGGIGVIHVLITALASEYELAVTVSGTTCAVSALLVFGVSTAVSLAVSRMNKRIDMVEALKGAE